MVRTNNIKIVENSYGFRSLIIDGRYRISTDLAKVAAGKDKWLSEVLLECRTCKGKHPAYSMELHGQYCTECWEAEEV
ncbi:MAG: hypothetical protein ACK54F_03475 [Planctomycetia bacterium]|jgi:hypothetical protein